MNYKALRFFALLLPLLLFTSSHPVEEVVEVNWLTWEEAIEKAQNDPNPKKLFVDVYTDWCGWCKVMDQKTFSHPTIAKYMQEKFYMIKLNAEQREDIVFNGQTFKYIPQGRRGYHELAAGLLQGKMSYPTVVFLNEDLQLLSPVPGYHPPESFLPIATYFGDEHYLTEKWDAFQKTFDGKL